jgi:hypothetical protein
MDDAERTEWLIRQNRDLLALAAEVRKMVRRAQQRAVEACLASQLARIDRAWRRRSKSPRQRD